MKVKYIANIKTPTEYTGYLVNDEIIVPMDENNRHYKEVQEWIAQGNTPDPAFTQDELDKYEKETNIKILESMAAEGGVIDVEDNKRRAVGANPLIDDKNGYHLWLKDAYNKLDTEYTSTLPKPPAKQRQMMEIHDDERDPYTFTRFHDQWGYRWYLHIDRKDVTALAIAIYDKDGNYLYTTGALLPDDNGGWYTECPAGQADQTKSDVYYRWLLGSAPISDLEVYKATDEVKKGFVRHDERYDKGNS